MVLSVEGLRTQFVTEAGVLPAVDGVSFGVDAGETLGVVGESGCGKSVTALSILRLVSPPGRVVDGSVKLEGRELLGLSEEEMRRVRGKEISLIFQEPMTALNPVLTVERQIGEILMLHEGMNRKAAADRAVELLSLVKIPEARQRLGDYPHQLSGGMRQRVMIAMALACNPKVLIADEPTTALDVTIQAQILELILEVQQRLGTAMILITHDLGVVAETADRVVVMYAGRKVEEASVADLFENPQHPYTHGLLASVPRLTREAGQRTERLAEIPGIVPPLEALPAGCHFAPRCSKATDKCRSAYPPLEAVKNGGAGHHVACWEAETGGSR